MSNGRRPLGSIPTNDQDEKWYKKVNWMPQPRPGQMKEIRLYGGAVTVVQHWVQFVAESGKPTKFAILCPGFDVAEATYHEDRYDRCSLCKYFREPTLPRELRSNPVKSHLEDAFDMDAIRDGARSGLIGVVPINGYGLSDIANVVTSLQKKGKKDLSSIDDKDHGYSVMWTTDPDNKDAKKRVSFAEGNPLPLKFSKKRGLYLLPEDEDYDAVKAEVTDLIGLLVTSVPDSQELIENLKRIGLHREYEEVTGVAIFGKQFPGAKKKKEDAGDWDEDQDEEEALEEEREESPKRSASSKKKKVEEEDDDWEEEEEETPRRKKRKKAEKSSKKKSKGEDDEDWDEEEDKEEAWNDDPPPRKSRKKKKVEEEDDDWEEEEEEEEEEETPPSKRRRVSEQEDDDDWDTPPKRTRSKRRDAEDDDRPTKPSRRKKRQPASDVDDWD